MCLRNGDNFSSSVSAQFGRSPRSPWRHMIRQPLRPRLSRRVIKSARVNLNRYWNKFEEMANNKVPLTYQTPVQDPSITDNETNENTLNEWLQKIGN